jgi:predicted nucleic acid-binding protein
VIVVDSSVWISLLRAETTLQVDKLLALDNPSDILIGDLVLLEVLQGARDERHATSIESEFSAFPIVPMLSPALAPRVAANYRLLRERGITVRKTADLIIGTFCIEGRHRLLHADRDFDPMVEHLGLALI